MNLFKALVTAFIETPFHKQALHFVAASLKTDSVCLLITDKRMKGAYDTLMENLVNRQTPLLIADLPTLHYAMCEEMVIVHSHFDVDLLARAADNGSVKRIIYIAENVLESQAKREIEDLEFDLQRSGEKVDVVFAYYDRVRHIDQLIMADTDGADKIYCREDQ